jgi:hypothetical protein
MWEHGNKGAEMQTHDDLVEAVFNLPRFAEIDFDLIDAMPDSRLREILGIPEPVAQVLPIRKNKRGRKPKPLIKKPHRVAVEFVERDGRLMRRETWRRYSLDGQSFDGSVCIPCGARVVWDGRTVAAGVVLHWLRTGEKLPRLTKQRKPYRGRVRGADGALIHLGYFATAQERDAAVLTYRLNPAG